ncbi:MAG: hypothetical protein PHW74_05795 [Desulfobacca sp.]|nr:hypothetical protein [Desulfobacca sp.]
MNLNKSDLTARLKDARAILIKKPKKVKVDLQTPFLKLQGCWEADEVEQRAAWELYVELVTRIALEELRPGEGLLRDALTALQEIFIETRQILKNYGPTVARPKGEGNLSLGAIVVAVLNSALRPVLAKWHPLLLAYEDTKKVKTSAAEHEAAWEHNAELRAVLVDLKKTLQQYSLLLAEAAGIPPLKIA